MVSVKLLFMDVDGTLTDGKIYMAPSGELCKAFDIKDGYGIHTILPKYNIVPVIITARESQIVVNRCWELGIQHIFQNIQDKRQKMIAIAEEYGITLNDKGILPRTAFIGDDIPDLQCLMIAQYKGCPADAVDEVKAKVDYISDKAGGTGAVREFIDWLCKNEI